MFAATFAAVMIQHVPLIAPQEPGMEKRQVFYRETGGGNRRCLHWSMLSRISKKWNRIIKLRMQDRLLATMRLLILDPWIHEILYIHHFLITRNRHGVWMCWTKPTCWFWEAAPAA
jgi:hypothetical protein